MISHRELREISLTFRRISSNFLNATYDTADVQLERFKKYIDSTPFIFNTISATINNVDFDYKQCFDSNGDWGIIRIPVEESCHIKAMYDYITQIQKGEYNVWQAASLYSRSSNVNKTIQEFLNDAFKPLIDFIIDAISKEMILVEDESPSPASINQNVEIGILCGTLNQQGTGGTIISNNFETTSDLVESIQKIVDSLNNIQEVSQEEIDSVTDDFESVIEQISSSTPKKQRIQKALSGIKKFATNFSVSLATSLATKGITEADWSKIVEQIQMFVSNIG